MRIQYNLIFLCLMLLVFGLNGCASVPFQSAKQESLSELCQQMQMAFAYDPVTRSARLSKNSRTIYVLVGSDVVATGPERVLLSAPVSLHRGNVYVPGDFREKVMCYLDRRLCAGRVKRSGFRIVLDPGHGGKDPGAVGAYNLKEKDVALDISQRLARQLERSGYDVVMTRTKDKFISLEQRTEYASEYNADLFISVHANSCTNRRATGFEVWAPRVLNHHDISEKQRKKNHRMFFEHLNMRKGNVFLEKTLEDMFYQHKYVESLKLASSISRGCCRKISSHNRGVKQSGFFVLRNTLVPSVLIEVGFISNARDARRFKDSSYRQKVAETLADGIKDYIRK